jgi:hypothetical protein
MAIKSNWMSLAVLVLSTIGASALTIQDIALLVLPDEGNPNNADKCTKADFDALAIDLDEQARAIADNYVGHRRALKDNEHLVDESSNIVVAESGHRKLVNCAVVCAGFAYGHCKLVYPECAPRRQLVGAPIDNAATTPAEGLRGSDRQLAITMLENGFVKDYSVDDPEASSLCTDLMAALTPKVLDLTERVPLTGSCADLWRKQFSFGCVYVPAL